MEAWDRFALEQIADQWGCMTMTVIDLRKLPVVDMQLLLHDTYMVLTQLHKDALLPKEVTKIFLQMEEYLYFASIMEDVEVPAGYYCHRLIYAIVKAFKDGFFNANYICTFPELQILDDFRNAHIINLESNFLAE